VWSTCDLIEDRAGSVSIGRPIANTDVFILDSHLNPVPVGISGELYIGGAGLARGYLGRPELTAERFIPDNFSRCKGARLYKTGDLARYLEDGRIELLGRTDQQVKLRGFRIELGEIETALRRLDGVQEAVVVVREDAPGEQRLVAYVVSAEGARPTATEMRRHMRREVPDYMIPSAFVSLKEIPQTPNGKIDRRALPPPDKTRYEMGQTFRAPRNRLESQLAQIWEDLLQVRPVGTTDNFFELGGHSLLAKRLMIRIEKRFGHALPLTAFFQEPTVEAMARLLCGSPQDDLSLPLVAIQPRGEMRPFYCVHSIGGDVMRFYQLALALGEDQPFYAFQAAHPSELGDRPVSIEEMASQYTLAMRAVQPEGPYMLGGYSFGSVVAFEMAQQLIQQGEDVALLALLDGSSPLVSQAAQERSDAVVLAGFARDLARASSINVDLPHHKIKQMGNEEGIHYILDVLTRHDLMGADTEADYLRRFLQGLKVRTRAVRDYKPAVYPGPITLFRSSEVEQESASAWREAGVDVRDRARGWDHLTKEPLEIHSVPGHHATMVSKPNVEVLAKKLKDCIYKAREKYLTV
jgi:thioesterase domain-containing protein/acyl carrier protein